VVVVLVPATGDEVVGGAVGGGRAGVFVALHPPSACL